MCAVKEQHNHLKKQKQTYALPKLSYLTKITKLTLRISLLVVALFPKSYFLRGSTKTSTGSAFLHKELT